MRSRNIEGKFEKGWAKLKIKIDYDCSFSSAWFSLATQAQAAYTGENERRHKHQNQPRQPPFCSNEQTQEIWNECFNIRP